MNDGCKLMSVSGHSFSNVGGVFGRAHLRPDAVSRRRHHRVRLEGPEGLGH